jgi:hypothetical protein
MQTVFFCAIFRRLSHNDSYVNDALSSSNATGDLTAATTYGEVFVEDVDAGLQDSGCEFAQCITECSCNENKGWYGDPKEANSANPSNVYTVTSTRKYYGNSNMKKTCYKAKSNYFANITNCEYLYSTTDKKTTYYVDVEVGSKQTLSTSTPVYLTGGSYTDPNTISYVGDPAQTAQIISSTTRSLTYSMSGTNTNAAVKVNVDGEEIVATKSCTEKKCDKDLKFFKVTPSFKDAVDGCGDTGTNGKKYISLGWEITDSNGTPTTVTINKISSANSSADCDNNSTMSASIQVTTSDTRNCEHTTSGQTINSAVSIVNCNQACCVKSATNLIFEGCPTSGSSVNGTYVQTIDAISSSVSICGTTISRNQTYRFDFVDSAGCTYTNKSLKVQYNYK